MSDNKQKTNPLVKYLGHKLGLVTHEEITSFVTKATGVSNQSRPDLRSSMVVGQSIPPDMKAEEYLKAYVGWVYACINILATETANIDLTLYKRTKQNEFDVVDSHPVLDLLYKVNPLYTSYLLWESTEAYIDLMGECFWWMAGPTPNPKEIWVLRPDWVNVKDMQGKLISSFEYGPPGDKKVTIPFEQIIHFKDFNPRNVFRGYGTVKAGAKSIDENNFQQDYSRLFFYNSAMPAGGLQSDQQLTDEQYKRIRDDWNAVHQGKDKAWKIAILESGLKWQDIGVNQREMDFIEGRKLTRDEVLAMFRVPKPLLTFDDVNRAAAKEARAILLENVITHKMKRIVSFLNEFLLPRYGDDTLFFDFKNPVPNDETLAYQKYANALQNGWMTRNEVREEQNLVPIDGGDKLMIPFSLQDIGATLTPAGKSLQKKMDIARFNVRTAPYSYFKSQIDQLQVKLTNSFEKLLRNQLQKRKVIHKLSTKTIIGEIVKDDDERTVNSKVFITRTEPNENQYRHILNALLTDQKSMVDDMISTGLTKAFESKKPDAKIKASINEIDNFVSTQGDVFSQPLMDWIRTVIEAEGRQQIQSIVSDGIFYMQTPEIQKYLKKDGVKFIQSINEETATQLRNTLAEAIGKQESIPQIRARVEAVYQDAMGYRSEMIARSEVLRATNFSTMQAYIQSGVVEGKEWLTAHDERTCPWCAPLDGKQIQLSETFYEEGDTAIGENDNGKKVYLPIKIADIGYPPLHPNCRCTLIPIISDTQKSITRKKLLDKLARATLDEVKQSQK